MRLLGRLLDGREAEVVDSTPQRGTTPTDVAQFVRLRPWG